MTLRALPLLLAAVSFGFGQTSTAVTNPAEATRLGRELAAELRSRPPADNATLTGVLKIRAPGGQREQVPLRFQTCVTATNWLAIYETTAPAANTVRTKLIVTHHRSRPNEYLLLEMNEPAGGTDTTNLLTGNATMIPFAGSDFWLADLGLEFLHWPTQRVIKKEMRRGQFCHVLESTNPKPAPNVYARVVSWIDLDTGGIVQAEAYDPQDRLIKEFAPKEFKKVDGQWQLREMEIRNLREGSRTRLEFELEQQ
jgi:hypothetical protein